MKYFNDSLASTLTIVDLDIETLHEEGDRDSASNYLYFLRDEVNKRIRQENAKRRKEEKERKARLYG